MQEGLATAQRHVTIASLYLGTGGGREAEFAAALAAAAYDATRPHLQIHVLLDALRSTRPTSSAAAPEPAAVASSSGYSAAKDSGSISGRGSGSGSAGMTSTAEMLAVSLLEGLQQQQQTQQPASLDGEAQGAARVTVSLFHTPALRGLLKRWVSCAPGSLRGHLLPAALARLWRSLIRC